MLKDGFQVPFLLHAELQSTDPKLGTRLNDVILMFTTKMDLNGLYHRSFQFFVFCQDESPIDKHFKTVKGHYYGQSMSNNA